MIYLSLLRFRIDLLIHISLLIANSTPSPNVFVLLFTSTEFIPMEQTFQNQFCAIACSFGFMLIPLLFLVVKWSLRNLPFSFWWYEFLLLLLLLYCIQSLFQINYQSPYHISCSTVRYRFLAPGKTKILPVV